MENNQMEIVLVAEVANDAKAKDARDFADLQLAMIGGGCAEVSLS